MEKVRLILVFTVLSGMIVLFTQKDKIINRLSDVSSKAILETDSPESTRIYEQFNLENQGSEFEGSFLEFGAKSCIACRRMEDVLVEITEQYKHELSIQFYNITERDGLELGRQFGVVMIPMQILLDKDGCVVYKHVGYISTSELSAHIESRIINN